MDYRTGESLDALHSADMNSDSGDFEINICFELAQDPIVTLCGHIYCWPCLYECLQVHSHSHECPVCKALIEEHKLVPIYGRGKASSDPRSRLRPGINIPKRPVGQRPQTAPAVDMDYLRPDHELDSIGGSCPCPYRVQGLETQHYLLFLELFQLCLVSMYMDFMMPLFMGRLLEFHTSFLVHFTEAMLMVSITLTT